MPIHMIEKTIIDLKAIIAGLASYKTVVDDTKALANAICAALQGNFVESLPALAIGSTKTNVANGAFDYLLGGKRYSKAANPVGTAGNADVIPQNKYGAMAFDIDNTGTITAISAVANAAGYASAALAVAGLPAPAAGRRCSTQPTWEAALSNSVTPSPSIRRATPTSPAAPLPRISPPPMPSKAPTMPALASATPS